MSAYDSMAKQIKKVNAIVDFKDFKEGRVRDTFKPLEEYLSKNCYTYGFCFHNRDVVKETGQLKTYHLHACFILMKKKRISTIVNDLAEATGVAPLAVTVKSMSSFEGSFQYLIHKNDADKFQYPVSDIVTNLDDDEVSVMLDARSVGLGFAEIKAICIGSSSMLEVIEKVGLGTYQHYRAAIQDIWSLVSCEKRNNKPL